ncbi:MAG: biliverdin-producing heme oxygenase [Opitutales bacterium]|nr:biliverdin-producing heme oxygenase [Opitutales bacterium]MCH8539435.1 biliverdin-producing heme oxygenase [Opitutales bacterium]
MQNPFSVEIRESTRKSHRMVENAAFIRGFLRGYVDPHNYLQLITDYGLIYSEMEKGIRQAAKNCRITESLYFPQLFRTASLEKDIAFFHDSLGRKKRLSPTRSAFQYRDRITEITTRNPHFLAAHIYTRYLGDLSGGRILRKVLSRALSLKGPEGLAFYAFPQIDSIPDFKTHFRSQLDNLPADRSQQVEIITEANLVFRLNGNLFNELKGNSLRNAFRLLWPTPSPFLKTRVAPSA